jgi:cytochrome c-type biogenesis protein CcmF
LFLGFASTIIPFGFAIAGLWTKKFGEWTRAALPWALFSAAILGTGIMMGGAWAYESLNFGGYWAWDPVENASMVPWLVLIAGIHTLLIYKHTGRSLRATHFFFLLCFGLVLYSTFLTRTGILGDTSVHAFTGEGKSLFYHLEIFLAVFLLPAFILYGLRYKNIPHVVKEEQTSSREFWMFIGSLVFFLTAMFIIGATSLPVINKFGTNLTMGAEPVYSYNRIIIFVAIVIAVLSAVTQYLKYKQTGTKFFIGKIIWPTVIAIAIASLVLAFGNINYTDHGDGFLAAIWLALVCSIYSVIANAAYIWIGMKGKLNLSGGSIAHLGFGLMLVGILISSSKKEVLSWNTSGIFVPLGEGSKEKAGENLTLIKGVPTPMGDYMVTYESDSMHPKKQLWFYKLNFKAKDGDQKFELMPNAFINYKGNQGLMANPDAKRFWNYDIFTYITSLPDPEKNIDTSSFQTRSIKIGDTVFYSRGFAIVEGIEVHKNVPGIEFGPNDSASVSTIRVVGSNSKQYESKPILVNKGGSVFMQADTIMPQNLVFQLQRVNGNSVELGMRESDAVMKYITLKAYKFPFINLLWGGTILMVIGIFMSIARRISLNKAADKVDNLTL